MKDIRHLLQQVNLYKKYQARFQESEDRFNMFKICGVNHYENTHSAIIAELLKNDGSHNFKDKFLEALIHVLFDEKDSEIASNFNFTLANVNVITEFTTNFGRIDILIKNDYQCIIIENKIYATDQFEQLKRYYQFGTSQYNDQFSLFYLTLWGNEAAEHSGKDIKYTQISYCDTIIKWLERCIEISARVPTVRETLIQYSNHIKYLTNNNIEMDNELIDLLSQSDNINAVFTIGENFNHLRNHMINKVFLPQLNTLCENLHLINCSNEYDRVNTA